MYTSQSCHTGSHSVTCLCPAYPEPERLVLNFIYLSRREGMLSWSKWLVTYWDGLPTRSWSPIQVLRRPDIEQQLWSRPMRNCKVRRLRTWPDGSYATPLHPPSYAIEHNLKCYIGHGMSIVFDMRQRAGHWHISAGNILLFNNYQGSQQQEVKFQDLIFRKFQDNFVSFTRLKTQKKLIFMCS